MRMRLDLFQVERSDNRYSRVVIRRAFEATVLVRKADFLLTLVFFTISWVHTLASTQKYVYDHESQLR